MEAILIGVATLRGARRAEIIRRVTPEADSRQVHITGGGVGG
ncbi:MAG: hypothetical protein ACXV49_06555 [Halobacteriota archaeon]